MNICTLVFVIAGMVLFCFWTFVAFFFLIHHSVCMVGITFVYIEMIFAFLWVLLKKTHLYCLVGCLSTIVWTHAVLGVLYMHVFCILVFALCSA